MIRRILSISGKPGLYRMISQGKNMLIVEALATKKRQPVYARDKVVSLADISIYTQSDDKPLPEVLEAVKAKAEGQKVDVAAFADDAAIREYFREVLPDFDDDRVYTSDIKKLLQWYNYLIDNDITEFVEPKQEAASEAAPAEAPAAAPAAEQAGDVQPQEKETKKPAKKPAKKTAKKEAE